MAANRAETNKSEGDIVPLPNPKGGGLAAWLPLILTIVLMPVLAWATTTFLLLPRLQKSLGVTAHATEPAHGESAEGGAEGGHGGGGAAGAQDLVPMNKLLVNVAGTLGSRYLLTSFTLAGRNPDFRAKLEKNDAQLRDLACGILSTKTINDLEKPTIRNQIRSELVAAFNNVLGPNMVKELYITELAIQ